jgi:hypothetical protein
MTIANTRATYTSQFWEEQGKPDDELIESQTRAGQPEQHADHPADHSCHEDTQQAVCGACHQERDHGAERHDTFLGDDEHAGPPGDHGAERGEQERADGCHHELGEECGLMHGAWPPNTIAPRE